MFVAAFFTPITFRKEITQLCSISAVGGAFMVRWLLSRWRGAYNGDIDRYHRSHKHDFGTQLVSAGSHFATPAGLRRPAFHALAAARLIARVPAARGTSGMSPRSTAEYSVRSGIPSFAAIRRIVSTSEAAVAQPLDEIAPLVFFRVPMPVIYRPANRWSSEFLR